MANIIKIPCGQNQGQNLLPFSDISHIKTYCTPHNFTYSMNSDHQWGEYTLHTPSWATTNYWMDQNLVPESSNPSWSLIDDGTTVRISPSDGKGIIDHHTLTEITCYIVAKPVEAPSGSDNPNAVLQISCDGYDYPEDVPPYTTHFYIDLFNWNSNQNQIGIDYNLAWQYGARRISFDPNRNYHIFAFKGAIASDTIYSDFTLNVDGTSESFQERSAYYYKSIFPWRIRSETTWDIKLIAFLDIAESNDVIANNVNILRMIYE